MSDTVHEITSLTPFLFSIKSLIDLQKVVLLGNNVIMWDLPVEGFSNLNFLFFSCLQVIKEYHSRKVQD